MAASTPAEPSMPLLLEGRSSPSAERLSSYHHFLQRIRGEISDEWRCAYPNGREMRRVESATDSLINLALLQAFMQGRDPANVPNISRLLHELPRPSIRGACGAARAATGNLLVRSIFALGMPSRDLPIPGTITELDWVDRLITATDRAYGMDVPVTVFGDYHQLCMNSAPTLDGGGSGRSRRSLGVHYTPAALVDYLTSRALRFMTEERSVPVDNLRILDPACGCGAFLVGALRFLIGANDASRLRDKLRRLSAGIRGCDIDRSATSLALQSLLLTIGGTCRRQRLDDHCASHVRSLADCIRHADFLRGRPPFGGTDRPNVILGGPPFVRVEQLHRSHANRIRCYRQRFSAARTGQFDLYMLFIERALKVLAPGGCLAMSVSGTFMRSKCGRVLRRVVSEQCRIIEIVEFDDRNVYPDADTHLVLLSAWKTDPRSCSRYVLVKGVGRCRKKLTALCGQGGGHKDVLVHPFPSCALSSDEWRFDPPARRVLLKQMETVGVPLATLPVTISLGACTGADDVFMLRHVSDKKSGRVIARHRLTGKEVALERHAIRPILRGRGIAAYGPSAPRFVCIFPYDRAGVILDECTFTRSYPRTYEYLASHRTELLKRCRNSDRPWYALRTVDITRVMAAPKLVASVIGRPGSFAIDVDGVLCHNSVLTIAVAPEIVDPYFLLGVLNSRPMRLYVGYRTIPMGAGRCAYRLDAVRQIPIPVPGMQPRADICAAVARHAQDLIGPGVAPSRRRTLQQQIDRLVMQLYGLSRRDAACLAETQAVAG